MEAESVSYAIRFKPIAGNAISQERAGRGEMVMAYKIEWHGDFAHGTVDPGTGSYEDLKKNGPVTSYIEVTSRYLGPNWKGEIDDVSNKDFWSSNSDQDVVRRYYALGIDCTSIYDNDKTNPKGYGWIGYAGYIVTSNPYYTESNKNTSFVYSFRFWTATDFRITYSPGFILENGHVDLFPVYVYERGDWE